MFLPFTPPFRRWYRRIFEARLQNQNYVSKTFDETQGWDNSWRIKPALETLWNNIASVRAYQFVLAPVVIALSLIAGVVILRAVPAASVSIIGTSSPRGGLWTWVLYIFFAIFVNVVSIGIPSVADRLFSSNRAVIGWFIVISIVWAGIAAWATRMPLNELATSSRIEVATGIIAGLTILWAFLAILGIWVLFLAVWTRRIEQSMPDIVVVNSLLRLLTWHSSLSVPDPSTKKMWVDELEKAARCLERDIARKLSTGDAATDRWVEAGCIGMATAVRDLKRSVIAPDAETWKSLPNVLAETAVNVGSGTWRKVPSKERDPIARQSLPRRLLGVLRTVVVAALPGLLLWILAQTPFALENNAAQWATIAALAWALVSLLIRVDPLLRDKLDTIDRVLSLARGGERKQ
jgi:hypothetical protein